MFPTRRGTRSPVVLGLRHGRRAPRAGPAESAESGNVLKRRHVVGHFLAGVATAASASARADAAPPASPASVVGYQEVRLTVENQQVPCSVWFPLRDSAAQGSPAAYAHRISVNKIARTLLGPGLLSNAFQYDRTVELRAPGVISADTAGSSGRAAVVLAHGFLGSRADWADTAEALAREGYVVVAPEFGDSREGNVKAREKLRRELDPGGVYGDVPPPSRSVIFDAALVLTRETFPEVGERIGLCGFSAGAFTVGAVEAPYPRVLISGFSPRDPGSRTPQLVIVSSGDSLVGERLGLLRSRLPQDTVYFEGAGAADAAAIAAAEGRPTHAALILSEQCHISFLSKRSNDFMVETLKGLLPVARFLRVPVLDFDTYMAAPDSEETAELVLPILTSFFDTHVVVEKKGATAA
mmetsp:Transcript_23164/g.75513  ORF Transcript_23164/g.75513 Transcript_23164/m.75513 type:complete len:411 (-) Transcript_23164:927-2159(-)